MTEGPGAREGADEGEKARTGELTRTRSRAERGVGAKTYTYKRSTIFLFTFVIQGLMYGFPTHASVSQPLTLVFGLVY